ncbi:patatin-like phospholipase family protein [Caballeronia sp. SEWSISQ10-4 2]|uniref:patatin-like phospholipase family protein n=1 Tax=Caballeronia sp. SEWSISQ10-4 2 TaxID=2937438 RepID=UPI00264C315E|nr:patatin-like phospholipase family protein [Caballeronia sp. SEWSISQ10-4 2]MDN7179714.1 patatin-like phospholipase family protein [Caballeronia sp. SEWSISQ10-4 2]
MAEQDTQNSEASANGDSSAEEAVLEIDPYVEQEAEPEAGVFELGLVLAGAISAGAYSAGVLDFLIEALDAWEDAKTENQAVPMHRVRIRVIAGASAGSMNGAIASVALQYDFPHVRSEKSPTNPFYDSWVKSINIKELLAVKDLAGSSAVIRSVLDSTVLQTITDKALDYQGPIKPRPYLDGRVRYIFTQGGLRGIPYYLKLTGNTGDGLSMSLHKAYRSFSIGYNGKPVRRRPDDLPLTASIQQSKSTDPGWQSLGNAALGSGAFPIGLAPRLEKRNVADLNYRYVTMPGEKPIWLKPAWAAQIGATLPTTPSPCFDEFVVDGGTMDNEPLDFARAEMAGTAARNERSGDRAKRAMIMVDPFPDALITDFNQQKTGRSGNLISAGMDLLGAWKNQARFNPVDLALALDGNVFSRFLIAPSRKTSPDDKKEASNGYDLASGALGGFSGFLAESYRHHDYLLGRRNCQQFLSKHFTLPASNPLFPNDPAFRQQWALPQTGNQTVEIPIIPLVGAVALDEPLPDWPTKPVDLKALKSQADKRLRSVVNGALAMAGISGWKRWLSGLGVWLVKSEALDRAIGLVQKDLHERNLPTTPSDPYVTKPLPTDNDLYRGS